MRLDLVGRTLRSYKPDEEAYLTAVDYLDLEPAEVMMVAAHKRDLDASCEAGLQTTYNPPALGVESRAS